MPEINVVDQQNNQVGTRELSEKVFGLDSDEGFVHRVYSALSLGQRAGTHKVKTCAEVSGGGRKPWKQKGTGRARQGSTRSAQWRHGGVAHGPEVRGYASRINKKERRRAMCLLLSDAVRQGQLIVVDDVSFEQIKTKQFVGFFDALGVSKGVLVLDDSNVNVERSGRNVLGAKIVRSGQLNLQDVLKYDHLVMTSSAVDKFEGSLV
ncbi:MAG: 50S ribosomal protein L4 [Mariprofundaceae bacterium]|nr:50S ribosomal protein L4 [Mariprofundaceae bacterium]